MTDNSIKAGAAAASGATLGFLVLLVAMSGLGPLSMQMIVPSLPALALYFNQDIAIAQMTVSLYLVGLAISQLVVGPLSDRYGRRPVILAGLALMVLSNLAGIFAVTLPQLIAARFIQAVGAAAGLSVGRAMIRDLYDRDKAAGMIGIVVGSMMIAPMISPFIGGVLETNYGWRAVFWCLGGVSLVVLLWAVALLPETRRVQAGPDPVGFKNDVKALMASPAYHGFVLCQMLAAATFFIFASGGAYVTIGQMGRSSAEYGAWFATGALAYMAGNLTSARLSPRLGVNRMIWIGLGLQIFGSALNLLWGMLGYSANPAWLFITQMIVAYGNGYVMSNAAAGAISVRPQAAGTASGVMGFLQMGFGAIVSQIGAYLGGHFTTTVPLNAGVLILSVMCAVVVGLLISNDGKAKAGS